MSKINVYIDSDGIMRVEYPIHAIVTIQDIQEEYRKRCNITNKKTPLLVKVHGVASFSEDAQEFLCSADHTSITSSAAVVTDPETGYYEHSKILIDIFKLYYKPSFELKRFDNEEVALNWLKTYLGK